MEEISPVHTAFVSQPSPSNQAHDVDHSAKKAYAHLIGEPMYPESEKEADKSPGTEPSSLKKSTASSPHAAAALGAEPTWTDGCGNRQRDEQREEASSACIVEPQGAVEGSGIEASEQE